MRKTLLFVVLSIFLACPINISAMQSSGSEEDVVYYVVEEPIESQSDGDSDVVVEQNDNFKVISDLEEGRNIDSDYEVRHEDDLPGLCKIAGINGERRKNFETFLSNLRQSEKKRINATRVKKKGLLGGEGGDLGTLKTLLDVLFENHELQKERADKEGARAEGAVEKSDQANARANRTVLGVSGASIFNGLLSVATIAVVVYKIFSS